MFLAYFLPALLGGLATVTASLVGRAILALGIGFVTYSGITFAIDSMKNNVMNSVSGLSADALGLLGYLWIDKGITIMFSAVAASIAMRGISGSVKKMVFK